MKNQEVISMFVKDSDIKFEEFMKKLYERVGVDKNDVELKLSYLLYFHLKKVSLVTLRDDDCPAYFLFDLRKPDHMSVVYVELIKKDGCNTGVYTEENICSATSTLAYDSANNGCDIMDTPILDIMTSAPTPQCPWSPLASRISTIFTIRIVVCHRYSAPNLKLYL